MPSHCLIPFCKQSKCHCGADIEQAKKKIKNNNKFFRSALFTQFLENSKPSLELGDQVFTARASVAIAVLLQVQSQTLWLRFDSQSWLYAFGAL